MSDQIELKITITEEDFHLWAKGMNPIPMNEKICEAYRAEKAKKIKVGDWVIDNQAFQVIRVLESTALGPNWMKLPKKLQDGMSAEFPL